MSILVRPVREQLEHDRVIRLLQLKWKKKFDAEINVGDERRVSVKVGQATVFPDVVLNTLTAPKRLQGVVEVETGESINHLEAMAQWTHMSRAKAPFQLYVPPGSVEQVRRLCDDYHVALAELWSFDFVLGDQMRLTLVHRNEELARLPEAPPAGKAAAKARAGKSPKAAGKAPAKGAKSKVPVAKTAKATERPTKSVAKKAGAKPKAAAARKPGPRSTGPAAARKPAAKPKASARRGEPRKSSKLVRRK